MHHLNSAVAKFPFENPRDEPPVHAWWSRGQLWIPPRSAYNPQRHSAPLLDCFLSVIPIAPGPERIDQMLEEVWPTISRHEAAEFSVHATIVRATARQYAEAGGTR